MIKNYKDAQIFYKFINRKSDVVNVYLHGWGCDYKGFEFYDKNLKNSSLLIDFPPFGRSSKNIKDWTLFTYANMVISLCNDLNIKKLNLIGHSFGGRVAIVMSILCKDEVNKLVLIDSAGLKPRRNLNFYLKLTAYKLKKKLNMDVSKYGSCDYKSLSADLKKIFISIVNTHLDDFLPNVEAETLIIFGKEDKTTPLYMAKKFKKKIKNSKLIILEGTGHFCFVERRLEILSNLKTFLN